MVFESSPEPEPEFEPCREKWGPAWPVHIYLFASLFALLTLYNLHSIVGLIRNGKNLKKKKIFLFANAMLASFNVVTSLQLFIDPYGSDEHHLGLMVNGLYFIAFGMKIPALTAAFSFIYIALTQTAKVQLYSPKLQNVKYFVFIIVIHFIVVLCVHLYLAFNGSHFLLIIICLSFFLLFSVALMLLFACVYGRLKRLIGGKTRRISTFIEKKVPSSHSEIPMSQIDSSRTDFTEVPSEADELKGATNGGLEEDESQVAVSTASNDDCQVGDRVDLKDDSYVCENSTSKDTKIDLEQVKSKLTDELRDRIQGEENHLGEDANEENSEDDPMAETIDFQSVIANANALESELPSSNDGNSIDDSAAPSKDSGVDDKVGEIAQHTSNSEEPAPCPHADSHPAVNQIDVEEVVNEDVVRTSTIENDSKNGDTIVNIDNSVSMLEEKAQPSAPNTNLPSPNRCVDSPKTKPPFAGSHYVLPEVVKRPVPTTRPQPKPPRATLNRVSTSFADRSLGKLLKLVIVVSLSSLLYCSAIVYYIVILVQDSSLLTDAWPWYIYQTVARTAEFGMTATMSYLVRRSMKQSRRRNRRR